MAENSRGQNRNGLRNKNNPPSNPSNKEQENNNNSSSGRLRNTDLDRMRNDNRNPKSSGLSYKRNILGTDYDGQLSDE